MTWKSLPVNIPNIHMKDFVSGFNANNEIQKIYNEGLGEEYINRLYRVILDDTEEIDKHGAELSHTLMTADIKNFSNTYHFTCNSRILWRFINATNEQKLRAIDSMKGPRY